MTTTNLFVELVVIGVGAIMWFLLLLTSLFGMSWLQWLQKTPSVIVLVPVLAITYLFGILTDRLADLLFDWAWGNRLRARAFPNREDYYKCRQIVLTQSESLAELLEYGRSRMRICRGWTLNIVLIALSANLLIWTQPTITYSRETLTVAINSILAILFIWSYFGWYRLVWAEYRKIKHQSTFLQGTKPREIAGGKK